MEAAERTVALFIDADNIVRPLDAKLERFNLESIVRRVREEGHLVVSNAYAEWGYFPCRDYIRDFSLFGMRMAELHSDMKGKNTADMQLTIDALEHAYAGFSADTFVLVSGDRDFVPLVQSLRRRGKRVICLCADEAASVTLKNICDVFISYASLTVKPVPAVAGDNGAAPAKEPAEVEAAAEASKDERLQAFETLVQAVIAIKRRGQQPIGGHVRQMMAQLLPSFDFIALGYGSFKEFIEAAEKQGIVKAEHSGVGDIALDLAQSASQPQEIAARKEQFSYSTIEDALASYKQILYQKRVPLIPWGYREPLVKHLWKALAARGEVGMQGWEMIETLRKFGQQQNWMIAEDEAVKLVYTLNIGHCFKTNGIAGRTSDILNSMVRTAVDVDKALEMMHLIYLRGMSYEDSRIKYLPEAVAELLFNNREQKTITAAQGLIYELYNW